MSPAAADVFERVMRAIANEQPDLRYRVFSGCAGWGPQQLEGELSRGDWFVVPACSRLVFDQDPYTVWDSLLEEVYRSKRLLPVECQHPEWN
ncbi:MAG: YqgE/AlgH family protein [Planctomycetaceae bacterium]